MRSLLFLTLLVPIACASTPTPPADPAGATPTPDAPSVSECPAPTEACMNEDNHAQCLDVAARCAGEVRQLETCPLQFSCSGPPADPVDDPDAPVSNTSPGYDPCAGKSCGDSCNVCAPDDADCVETSIVKLCDASGTCSGQMPTCE